MIQNTWNFSCTWWHTLVTPVVKRQGQEDPSLIKDSLDCTVRPCLTHSSYPSLRQKTCLELWRQAFESSCIPRHLWLLSWVLCTDKKSWFQESVFKQSCQEYQSPHDWWQIPRIMTEESQVTENHSQRWLSLLVTVAFPKVCQKQHRLRSELWH